MINSGFKLTVDDIKKLTDLKQSRAYRSYVKGVCFSPAYQMIIKEHIDNIDIGPDVKRLKREGKLPNDIPETTMNDLLKATLLRLSVNILADAVVIKELEDLNVDSVIDGIQKESDITYLMGLADEQYYEEAKHMVENGNISRNDLIFKGLMAHMAIKDKIPTSSKPIKEENIPNIEQPTQAKKKTNTVLNVDSKNIQL